MVMKKRGRLGKIQFTGGIIILIIGILGLFSLIYLKYDFGKKTEGHYEYLQEIMKESGNLSEQIRIAEAIKFINEEERMKYNYYNQKYFLISTSVILIILSFVLITQGLINKAENKKW